MGRISKEDIARLDGMRMALEIAQEHGVDGLKAEVEWRGALNICPQVKADKIMEIVEEVFDNHKYMLGCASAWAMTEKMHLPANMIEIWLEAMNERFELYKKDKDALKQDEKVMCGDTVTINVTKKFNKEETEDGYRIVKRG